MNKEKRVALRLYENQLKDLEILAKKHNSNISDQVRKAVEEYVLNQGIRNSLSNTRKEISKKTMFEKIKFLGGLILILTIIPIIFEVGFKIKFENSMKIAMLIGFPLALWALFYNNVIRKHLRITLIVAIFVLVSSLIIFWLLPHYQGLIGVYGAKYLALIKTFLVWFYGCAIGFFILLLIGVKIYGAKID